ncbi:MAG TPA: HRDC domain-containing protein [Pyrinomonadaceae bacterium]
MIPTVEPLFNFITDTDAARDALKTLGDETVVGLDTETFFDPKLKCGRVSLVQIASREGSVLVIDALKVETEVLRPLVESPDVSMAAHNARFDEMVLMGAGLRPVAFVDTLRMARMALSLSSYSLAAVSEHLFGLPLDKTLRQSNWHRRPLTRNQLAYAAADAHITLHVYDELRRVLQEQGRWEDALRISTLAPSSGERKTPRRRRAPQSPPVPLTVEEKRIVAHLKSWRLARANASRLPAYMICPDKTLEHLARARPVSLEALTEIHGLGTAKIERFGEELLEALSEAVKL